jgi:hypothetical protein
MDNDYEQNPQNIGVWFQSSASGFWYRNYKAAGEILAVKIDGIIYRKETNRIGA